MSSSLAEDREIADLALSEARETLNIQLDTQSDIDTKAARVLRVNTLVLGIIISVMSFVIDDSVVRPDGELFNSYAITGMVVLLTSIALSALTYSASDPVVGISRSDVETLVDGGYSDLANKEGLALAFGEWIEFNSETIDMDAFYFTSTTTALVWALSFLSLGFVDAVSHSIEPLTVLAVVTALVCYTYVTEWISQFRTWLGLVEPLGRVKGFTIPRGD